MKILAIDTSTEACSAALVSNSIITGSQYQLAPQQHSKLILPMIDDIFLQNNLKLADIDAIAFGQGPGSFTGLRIATSVAQALAFSYDLPVIPISTLASIALAAHLELGLSSILATIDARMGEIYYSFYTVRTIQNSFEIQSLSEEKVGKANSVELLPGYDWIAVGTACVSCPVSNYVKDYYPNAKYIALLAEIAYKQKKFVDAENALPIYLRNQVT